MKEEFLFYFHKFIHVLFNILLFPFNISIFFSMIYFKKNGLLNFNILDATDKFIEDLKKL